MNVRALVCTMLVVLHLAAGCTQPRPSVPLQAQAVQREAARALRHPCELPPAPAFVCTEDKNPARRAFDVVVYAAHPNDESMYAGGTLHTLARLGYRIALVLLSHGEGGRLLETQADGGIYERRDYSRAHVARVRDEEASHAAHVDGLSLSYLYPSASNVDFAFTTSCAETLQHWNRSLPEGVAGTLARLVADLREKRPRVVLTFDVRDDPTATKHAHHRALGQLVAEAVVLAADRSVRGARPHRVEELVAFAPSGVQPHLMVSVDVQARLRMLRAHRSQFWPNNLLGFGSRASEGFVYPWEGAARACATAPVLAGMLSARASP